MKTQRRHELQTNELADYLGKHLQRIQPYSRHITIGLAVVVVVVAAWAYYSNRRAAERGASWSDYFAALTSDNPDSDALQEVAKLHSGTVAALWSLESAGDIKLAMGTRQLFTDRDEAEETLKDAEEHFQAVEKQATEYPELVQRARYGLAQVYESLSNIEKARKYYEEVAKSAPDSALGKSAKRRFDRLANKSVQRWYAWFERQRPSLPAMPPSRTGAGPKVSDELDTLPERPDLSFPAGDISKDLKNLDLDQPSGKEPAEPVSTEPEKTPASGDEKTAAPKPEEAQPSGPGPAPKPAAEGAEPETQADPSVEKPASPPEQPAPAETAKPASKPAAADKDDTGPES